MRARMPNCSYSRLFRVLSCLLLASATTPVRADATDARGVSFDAQLTGGGGFAFRSSLDNPFLGRVRMGALYAAQPWMANVGATLQFGALARLLRTTRSPRNLGVCWCSPDGYAAAAWAPVHERVERVCPSRRQAA